MNLKTKLLAVLSFLVGFAIGMATYEPWPAWPENYGIAPEIVEDGS